MKTWQRLILVFGLLTLILTTQMACFEDSDKPPTRTTAQTGGGGGSGWLACASVTCKYKVGFTGATKTAFTGARINTGTASTVSGKWIAVSE